MSVVNSSNLPLPLPFDRRDVSMEEANPVFHLSPTAAAAVDAVLKQDGIETETTSHVKSSPVPSPVPSHISVDKREEVKTPIAPSPAQANTITIVQPTALSTPNPSHGDNKLTTPTVVAMTGLVPTNSMTMSSNPTSAVVYAGILTKLGQGLFDKWRTRYFVLKADDFTYYPSEQDYLNNAKPLGRLLVDSQLRCWSANPSDLEWKFITPDKTVVVRSTLADKKAWYDAVEGLVERLATQNNTFNNATTSADANSNILNTNAPLTDQRPSVSAPRPLGIGTTSRSNSVSSLNMGRPQTPPTDSLLSGKRQLSESVFGTRADGVDEADGFEEIESDDSGDMFTEGREATGSGEGNLSRRSILRTESNTSGDSLNTTASPLNRSLRSRTSMSSNSGSSLTAPSTMSPEQVELALEKRRKKSREAQKIFGWPVDEVLIEVRSMCG